MAEIVKKKSPSTIGEWDTEIEATSEAELLGYRAALATLREWEAFKDAFAWTRIFVLQQSIEFELEKRERASR